MNRYLVPLAAAALVGAVLPITAGSAAAAPAFGGYSSTAVAAPVTIQIFEPTIPIPANPQLEVDLAYTKVEADSGSSAGRASWLWPGDPVGEGEKTFVEQLGLPSQLGENGYPVQVNSGQPSGEAEQSDEPFPGTVMRTKATAGTTIAQAGFSPDSQVQDGNEQGSSGSGGTPGVPSLPSIPGLPGAPGLAQFGQAITGGAVPAAASPAPAAPGLPPELAALVDPEGYTSSSKNVATGKAVTTTARTALGDVRLLGGLVTLDGIVVTSTSTSDGVKATNGGKATLGGLTIAGKEFSFGPDGFTAAGQGAPIPSLPPDPAAALAKLGVSLTLPKPVHTVRGDQATNAVQGLQVTIDIRALRQQLSALPVDTIVNAFPDDPQQLKSAIQALAGLAPRIVVTLGTATTSVDTVKGIRFPTIPGTAVPAAGAKGGAPAAGSAAPASSPAAAAPAAGGAAPATGNLPASKLTGAGLPPLYTIPGAILAGGIALAALGGTWLRRIGVIALGGAGSCTHGLDSGLPDLRKAR